MPSFFLQIRQQLQDLGLNGHIERRCRLIGNQQVRIVGKRHGNHHTLTLATPDISCG